MQYAFLCIAYDDELISVAMNIWTVFCRGAVSEAGSGDSGWAGLVSRTAWDSQDTSLSQWDGIQQGRSTKIKEDSFLTGLFPLSPRDTPLITVEHNSSALAENSSRILNMPPYELHIGTGFMHVLNLSPPPTLKSENESEVTNESDPPHSLYLPPFLLGIS